MLGIGIGRVLSITYLILFVLYWCIVECRMFNTILGTYTPCHLIMHSIVVVSHPGPIHVTCQCPMDKVCISFLLGFVFLCFSVEFNPNP